ncbi:MAG: phosphoglycerate dehydrogenase [Planctomycetales bacterium]|nr:phosphoglycerate dehydrogenase [Planctomycetales bacterium]MBN8626106.1 phosphoglycerate dehydrogenase [Planctomycetota bacterium]
MPRIIVLDTIAEEGLALLKSAPGIQYEVRTGLKDVAKLREALNEFDGAILRSGVKITAEALEGNKRLKAIVRAGVGTDNIDTVAAKRLGIVVMNTPAGNTISTAEHAIALMMALSRNVAPAYQSLLEGKWDRNKYMGTQLAGKTIGVVGLGRIGLTVAARARAMEMRVLGYDPFLTKERATQLGIELYNTVPEMLPHCDYVTVHTPLTPETKGLIGKKELGILKKGVRLVNCARGGIYDEEALVEGLKSGQIGGVALDVFATEPCTQHALFGMPGVLCTPHLGASTEEAQTQVAVEGCQLLIDYLTTGAIRCAVNMSTIDPAKLDAVRGYLNLGYRLGLLLAQLAEKPAKGCKLTYRGEVAGQETKLITSAFAAGLLEHAMDNQANIVNADVLLKERGIELLEQTRADMGAFSSVIVAELTTEDKTYQAAATVFGHGMARLVQLGEFRLESYLDGVMLVFTHKDVPGIIGKVGTSFGKHGVNIAQMTVGRAQPGGEAVGILNLDNTPSAEALKEVSDHPAITSVKVIELPPAGFLPAWLLGTSAG